MTPVYLYGALGRKFGHRFQFDVKSPAEAVRAIEANRPGFHKYLIGRSAPGYHVYIGPDPVAAEGLHYPVGRQAIKIVPVIAGAGKQGGIIQMILGIVIVAASIITLQPEGVVFGLGLGLTGTAANVAIAVGFMGAGLAIGGIAQLLTQAPKGLLSKEDPANTPSTLFSGPVNTTAQGHPVPIGYGRLRVGSGVISAGIFTEDIRP